MLSMQPLFTWVRICPHQRLNAYILLELSGSLCSDYETATFVALPVELLGGIDLCL